MALGKRLINTGGAAAACLTETTDIFGDSSGVSLYSLDYDASDESGTYDGTPTDVDFGVDGQINYGARFNGSSSKITTSAIAGLSSVSVSIWLKSSNSTSTERRGIIEINSGTAQGIAGTLMVLYKFSNGEILVRSGNASSSETNILTHTDTSLRDGNWHNLIVTRNESTGVTTLYIDGSQVDQETVSNTSTVGQGSIIGDRYTTSSGNFNWDGSIDQVRVFSKAINQTEVDTLYAETACVYTSTTDIVNYPTGTTPVAYYKLDNSSEDYSTGGNDGTDTDVEYRFGRFGQAAVFNGSSSKIALNSSIASVFTDNFTFSAWVYPTDNSNYICLFDAEFGMELYFYQGSFQLYSNDTNSDTSRNIIGFSTTTTNYAINQWHHVALTFTKTSQTWYINGQQDGTNSTSSYTPYQASLISIGYFERQDGGTNHYVFNGKIDQVRIYDAALTDSQVTELYNEKPEVDTSNFKTVLWKGNNTTGHFINNVGMDLETNGGLVWIKSRNDTDNHIWQDNVRGITNYIMSSSTLQQSNSDMVVSLEKTGFVLGADTPTGVNTNNIDFVAWVWKGGGDAVSNSSGMGSEISANDKGFSIVKYTGSGSSGTVAHGLTIDGTATKPELSIFKATNASTNWFVLTDSIDGSADYLILNSTASKVDLASGWLPDTTNLNFPTSSGLINNSSGTQEMIVYCFASVSGYSKIGSYEGNTTTLPSITLGFKPSFVMVKNVDGSDNWHRWYMFDDKRQSTNSRNLAANVNSTEPVNNDAKINFEANGFSIANSSNYLAINDNGDTYLYMAFK